MAGFKSDPIAEHAAATEIAHAVGVWREVEQEARELARTALAHPGIRSDVIAEALDMSRATMYRWLSQDRDTDSTPEPKPARRRGGSADSSGMAGKTSTGSTRKGQGSTAGRSRVTPTKEAPLTLPGTDASTLEIAPGKGAKRPPQGPTGPQRGSAATEAQGAKRPKPSRRKPSQS